MLSILQSTQRRAWWLMCLCLLLIAGTASAQVDQGAITGTVTDNTGAIVPDAQVTLRATDTGLTLQSKSNSSGSYTFSPIKIGNYTVSAFAPGFQTTTRQNLHVDVQQRLQVNLALSSGPGFSDRDSFWRRRAAADAVKRGRAGDRYQDDQ